MYMEPLGATCTATAAPASMAVVFAGLAVVMAAIGLQRLDAPDAAAAEAMVLDQQPDAQMHTVDGAHVTEESRHRMLEALVRDPRQRPTGA